MVPADDAEEESVERSAVGRVETETETETEAGEGEGAGRNSEAEAVEWVPRGGEREEGLEGETSCVALGVKKELVGREGFRWWGLALAFWMAGGVAEVFEALSGRLLGEERDLVEALIRVDMARRREPGGRPGKR